MTMRTIVLRSNGYFSSRLLSSRSLSSIAESIPYYDGIPHDVDRVVSEHAQKRPTLSSLQSLMRTGRGETLGNKKNSYQLSAGGHRRSTGRPDHATQQILIHVSSFLRKEIPIRLAHRIQDLDKVPCLSDMSAVKAVKGIYIESFLEMIDYPEIHNADSEADFAAMLSNLYNKHAGVLVQMAKGAYELRQAVRAGEIPGIDNQDSDDTGLEFERMDECHEFLDRFYMSRIGIRFLAGQYLALRENAGSAAAAANDNHVGMICQTTSPSLSVRRAAKDASMMCRRQYGRAPAIDVTGCLDLTFPYIPTYLHYILLELLKNALRATAETHRNRLTLPPVTVIIADGRDNEDVVIKIQDTGGGIRRSQIDKIWSYLFTTADPSIQQAFIGDKDTIDHSNESPIAGLGYGLPIARSYSRYFGGDIEIVSLEGYGTDAFVYLKRLGDSKEPVPI